MNHNSACQPFDLFLAASIMFGSKAMLHGVALALICGLSDSSTFCLVPSAFAQTGSAQDAVPEGLEAGDWSSIRAAYEAGRHKAFETAEGFQARNPGQQWLTSFDGSGFLVQPNAGEWSWGLQLESYGFESHMQQAGDTAKISSAGTRVTYDWTDNVQEWYINDTRGLEHGFTLQSRPQHGGDEGGLLTFDLSVRGSLEADVFGDGSGVRFVNDQGASVVTYAGLHVFDANGVTQSATFVGGGASLSISIEEAGATYPLTIDPIAQQAYLKASNAEVGDEFGWSVAISGNLVVVGAHREGSDATGVNGDQSNNSAAGSGAAYIFERIGGLWTQQAYLKASNTELWDEFGASVAISGDLVVVGAKNEDSAATGVNGDQSSNNELSSGAVYIFERIGGLWTQQAYLKASNADAFDWFGFRVAISGDLVVVGAYGENGTATGINGNQSGNSASNSGAAYIFERVGGSWTQQAYLKASNSDPTDNFGVSVAISGNLVIVGAHREGSDATGVNGNQNNNNAGLSGAAYIFERVGGLWTQEAYLKASNAETRDWFGLSVAISGDLAVVGAFDEDSNATGVNGNQSNNSAAASGAAYIFERAGGSWTQQAYLKASNTEGLDRFGSSVAISGELVIVGAYGEDSDARGVNGDQSNNRALWSGAAYVFKRVGGMWNQQAYLKASNADTSDWLGWASVAISGNLAIVGAYGESSNATGVNGNQSNNSAAASGAAYIFDLSTPVANYCGTAVPNSSGLSASMSMSGSVVAADNNFFLQASDLPPNSFGYFLTSQGQGFVLNPGGSAGHLCIGGGHAIGRELASLQNFGLTGVLDYQLDLNDVMTPNAATVIQAGETWNFQCWFRDQATSNFTDGLSVQFE